MTLSPSALIRENRRGLIVAAGFVLLFGSAVVHGLWSDRWGGPDLSRALARLDDIPLTAGPWKGRPLEPEPGQAEAAAHVGIERMVRARFDNAIDGQAVSVVLMGGRFGPLSVHTPDACYGAAGYALIGSDRLIEVACDDGSVAAFRTARFRKPNAAGSPPLRVFWSWNDGDGWRAPANPRWAFRMKPVLYKLYVIREDSDGVLTPERDPAVSLLRGWVPTLNRVLTPMTGPGGDGSAK